MQIKNFVASALVAATVSAATFGFGLRPSQAFELHQYSELRSQPPLEITAASSDDQDVIPTDRELDLAAPGFARPDLVIPDWRVIPDLTPGDSRNNVAQGEPYRLCYVVRNIGNAAAGPFRVSGGGLGIGFNPMHGRVGLAAGASDVGCLSYPTTPAPGFYALSVMADATFLVAESNEGNNSRTEHILVQP